MRVVVAHGPDLDDRDLRQMVLGSGMDCGPDDCVRWESLSRRLGADDADLVMVTVDQESDASWLALRDAKSLTQSPVLAIGEPRKAELVEKARRFGVSGFLDRSDLRRAFDSVVEHSGAASPPEGRRGRVIAVYSPTPGSGSTTVAANLAGALLRKRAGETALLELCSGFGDIAMLLNLTPLHTAADVCRRWKALDPLGLKSSFTEHPSGLLVLANGLESADNPHLDVDSARRLAILARMTAVYGVLALDHSLSEVELESMRMSDVIALVVRPDVPAVRRAQWAIQYAVDAGLPRDRFHLVVNRFGQGGQLALTHIEETLGMRAAQLIPDDPRNVNRAANMGRLLSEQSRMSRINRRFASLAYKLNGVTAS